MASETSNNADELHAAADRMQPREASKPIDIQPPTSALGIAAASLAASARSFMPNPTLNSTRVQKKVDTGVEIAGDNVQKSSKIVSGSPNKNNGLPSAAEDPKTLDHFESDSSTSSSNISDMSADELYTYSQHALHQADEDDEWQATVKDETTSGINDVDSDSLKLVAAEDALSNSQNELPTLCLFCEQTFPTPELTVKHCQQMHNVDVKACCRSLDELEYIRLINYIRKEQVSAELLIDGKICMPKTAWNQDAYLVPVLPDDPMLTMLIAGNHDANGDGDVGGARSDDAVIDPGAFEKYSNTPLHDLVNADDLPALLTLSADSDQANGSSTVLSTDSLTVIGNEFNAATGVSDFSHGARSQDAGYFATYSHFGIHEEMLKDEIRTRGYLNAITNLREPYINNRIVLDVGCGTCILSAFAVRAGGARKVYAVDQADIVSDAFDILNENGGDLAVGGRIEVIRSTIEQVRLSTDHVDVIISEWMGYFLLFESMLESVLHARDRFMLNQGESNVPFLMIPNRAKMYMSLVSDEERYAEAIEYWDDVYGLKMSRIKRLRLKTPEVSVVPSAACISPSSNDYEGVLLRQFNLTTMKPDETEFETFISLPVGKMPAKQSDEASTAENLEVVVTALAGWFDVSVVLPDDASNSVVAADGSTASSSARTLKMFTTSPHAPETHWKQTVFYLPQKLRLQCGSTVIARVKVNKHSKDKRALLIKITLWVCENLEGNLSNPLDGAEINNVDSQKWMSKKPLLELTYEML